MSMSGRRSSSRDAFVDRARQARSGVLASFVQFLADNKKWWLTPIILTLLLGGALIVAGGTAAAPFVYPLF